MQVGFQYDSHMQVDPLLTWRALLFFRVTHD